jgi:putative acetyltransferase
MDTNQIHVRETNDSDLNNILEVEKQAFGYDKEAELVRQLLSDETAAPVVSLLAMHENEAVGHILFTKAKIEGTAPTPLVYILAPLAVKPGFQKQGLGAMLIREGLRKLKKIDVEMVFVLGHMKYYPQYGFTPDAGKLGFPAPYPIPPEHADAWMVQALSSDGLSRTTGKVICADALHKPEHWRE